MSKLIMKEAAVVDKAGVAGLDGRSFAELKMSVDGFRYAPGQFLMARKQDGAACWANPYIIQSSSEDIVTVLAREDSALYSAKIGDTVYFWGPNGKAGLDSGSYALLAQPETWFLVRPFVTANPGDCKGVVIIGGSPQPEGLPGSIEAVSAQADSAADRSMAFGAEQVIVALNYDLLRAVAEVADDSWKRAAKVFAATKMACGLGACKGCVLHHEDHPFGLSVCCEGPFIPFTAMDLETDKNCFISL